MISNTVNSKEYDNFKDYTFSANEWSAPSMVTPIEIRNQIDSFSLCGRKVKQMRLIGLSYSHSRDWIEDATYCQLDGLSKDERQRRSNYMSINPNMQFLRCAEIDEPLLIEFEDGDVFEIETPQEPEFRMSMNRIPWWIDAGTNQPNADADILFSLCIGQTIKSVEVNTYKTDKDPMFHEPFAEAPYERELVSDIILRFENGTGLRIGAWIDYCVVECVDAQNEISKINFSDLRQALFNWEDLHNDEATGFEAESYTLFFGEKGATHTDTPYMTLYSSGNDKSVVNIAVNDFVLLGWCITHATGEWFDEYGEYHFSANEWLHILEDAQRLLSFETFDALFDDAISWNIFYSNGSNCMISQLNTRGAEFWRKREKYSTQLRDICAWSKLVLTDDNTMDIYGF